jgi:hypothetical protein
MSYDTKAQKNRPELQSGVALSTLVFVEEDEEAKPEESEPQPPSTSTANDAD